MSANNQTGPSPIGPSPTGPNPTGPNPDRPVRSPGLDRRPLLAAILLLSLLASVAAVLGFNHGSATTSLFRLSNLVGPSAASLLAGHGLTVCTELEGTPGNPICFAGGRMPVATAVVAAGIHLFGDHLIPVALFKTVLLLLPVWGAQYLVVLHLPPCRRRSAAIALVLLLPFAMPAFLADVTNLQVEEGYSYASLALATALLLFGLHRTGHTDNTGQVAHAALLGASAAALFLSKSSMLPAAAVLTVAGLLQTRSRLARALCLGLALAGPIGWAVYQHAATSHLSLGTSLDGFNLHKGNNPGFLSRYPPAPGDTLDGSDTELNRGLRFPDEWSFDRFHRRAALTFSAQHPAATTRAGLRKAVVVFVSLRKIGSKASHGPLLAAELAGMAVFRVILWTSVVLCVRALLPRSRIRPRERPSRADAVLFLSLVAAVTLPYLLGFAYTRHVSVLIYPAALFCCRALASPGSGGHTPEGLH